VKRKGRRIRDLAEQVGELAERVSAIEAKPAIRIMLPKIVRCECGRIVETENVLRRECRQCQEDKMRRKWRDDFANWPKRVKEPTY
jgi:hypothetical protein